MIESEAPAQSGRAPLSLVLLDAERGRGRRGPARRRHADRARRRSRRDRRGDPRVRVDREGRRRPVERHRRRAGEGPAGPVAGEKDEIVGAGCVTVKLEALVAVPPPVVTSMGPVVAPDGTVPVICVSEFTVKVAPVPLKVTELAPVNAVPLITTVVPTGPLVGVKDEIVGAPGGVTSKFVELVAVPPAVVTAIGPVVAPLGTVAVIWASEFTTYAAAVPPNVTEVAPMNAEPSIDTEVPTGPLVGVNDEIVGAAGGTVLQPGSWKEPIRVFQLSWASVVGSVS